MNPQERELVTAFLERMRHAPAAQKDAEADALIREAVARQPDASYVLVQRAMALEYALQTAQEQAAKLQAELDRLGARSGSIEGPNAWGRRESVPAPANSWGSGMLGTVASTAAGVVAGSFLFHGIQGLMSHRNDAANMASPPASKDGLLDSSDAGEAQNDEWPDPVAADDTDSDSLDSV